MTAAAQLIVAVQPPQHTCPHTHSGKTSQRRKPSPNHSVNRALLMGMTKCLAGCVFIRYTRGKDPGTDCPLLTTSQSQRHIHHSCRCLYTGHTHIHTQPWEQDRCDNRKQRDLISHVGAFLLERGVHVNKCVRMCCQLDTGKSKWWHQVNNKYCEPVDFQEILQTFSCHWFTDLSVTSFVFRLW